MSSVPSFNQVDSSIYVLSTLADTGLDDYWAGYFSSADAALGTNASTAAVWDDIGGFYLFLDKTPSDWTKFKADLLTLRPALGPANTLRCLWISRVDQPSTHWKFNMAYANATVTAGVTSWQLMRALSFNTGFFLLSLRGLTSITYIPDEDGGGLSFAAGTFSGPEGGYGFSAIRIFFSGSALGAFKGMLQIPAPSNEQETSIWAALNIGLQYAAAPMAYVDQDLPEEEISLQMPYVGATRILFMPVFTGQSGLISFELLYDPLLPLVPTRTALSLFPAEGNLTLSFDSYLRTTKGYPLQLTALPENGVIPNARFVLGYCPVEGDQPGSGYRYHFSPDGAFRINVQIPAGTTSSADDQLLMGLSGLEYLEFGNESYMLVFEGYMPAFVPAVSSTETLAPDVSKALLPAAGTSYFTLLSTSTAGTGPVYFAQPREAPIYSGKEQRADGILDFNPMPVLDFTYDGLERPPVFPIGIYAGLNSSFNALAREIENSSLAPSRNYRIGQAYGQGAVSANLTAALTTVFNVPTRRVRAAEDPLGVTPQGLVVELTPDYNDFEGLLLGNMPGTNYPNIDLTAVEGSFKQALQSNQLFFVAANVNELMSATSVRYALYEEDKPYLLALGVSQAVIDAVYQTLVGVPQPFDTEGQFVACIGAAAGTDLPSFLRVAGILKVEMDGWTFQLSPRSWRSDPESPTLFIAKFCNRSLMDLANDTSSWAWPEVAIPEHGSLAQTQEVLLDIFKASSLDDATVPLRIFYETILNDPNWNGFLFLNAPVDIAELPDDLKFLTAGLDLSKFYAHHIGFSQTPFSVENGAPVLEQTAAFGLINYLDTLDLYADESIPLGFKTMQLLARFANASLVNFSTQVELMINQLLGASLTKNEATRGNNLIIDGSYQRVGNVPSYAFTLTGENIFNAANTALTQIEVIAVQLVTGGNTGAIEVLTTFNLTGNLRFFKIETFDLFSYGPDELADDSFLRFSGLRIDMAFSLATPDQQTFLVAEANMAFDMSPETSKPRRSSVANNFPLTVTGLISAPNLSAEGAQPTGQTPEDLGYTSISAPLDQTPMVPGWYGLVFILDLGTFGALTGSVGFKISILAAWSTGLSNENIPVYLGLKLPGIPAFGGSFPLQGVLKLGFRSFQFETYMTDENKLGYLMRLRRFAFSVFVWSFPPGNADIVLFGEPENAKGSLGWYAAYSDGKSSSSSSGSSNSFPVSKTNKLSTDPVKRRLQSGRRTRRTS